MTELQIGLIALGATAVVGVFGYNKWQENRHRKMAEAVLQPAHDDVLLGDAPRVAPVIAPRHEPEIEAEAVPPVLAQRVEPAMDFDQPESKPALMEKTEPVFAHEPVISPSPAEPFVPAMPQVAVPRQALASTA